MNVKWLYGTAGALLGAGLLTGAWLLGKSQAQTVSSDLVEEVVDLRTRVSDAAVIQRVSRQMEDIAYQQKEVSDRQRQRAEQQSELAQKMRIKAESESRAARIAEQNAMEAAAEAEQERANALRHQQEAEQQRDAANYSKSLADTLTYLTIGRTLGNISIDKFETGEHDLASKLAWSGWFLLKQYGGNTYQTEIFKPLNSCSGSTRSFYAEKGGGITAVRFVPERGVVYATDYGEIECLQPDTGTKQVLLQESRYDFRDVLADDKYIYAVSLHGPLLRVGYDKSMEVFNIAPGTYTQMEDYDRDHIMIFSENSVLVFGKESCTVEKTVPLGRKFSAVAMSPEGTYIFFKDGASAFMNRMSGVTASDSRTESPVTAAVFDSLSGSLYLGFDNGHISCLERDGTSVEVTSGHSSRITALIPIGDVLVSAGYDKRAEIVNISSRYNIASVSIPFSNWPLSLCRMEKGEVAAGLSDGSLMLMDTSTESMAEKIKTAGNYHLTEDEWTGYAGSDITYPSFL